MMSFKNYGWAFVMVINIMVASLFAKNMISYPLDYDFSCSYGVPFAIWETYSKDDMEHSRIIDGTYKVTAINIGDRSAKLNFVIDAIILFIIFYLLQKREKGSRQERLFWRIAFVLAFSLSLSLWVNIFSSWGNGTHRFFYLAAVFFEIILVLLAMIKVVIACSPIARGKG